jgi:catechol 2,3-dioxygenase-like lactoylglutathione lyase family enzyme
MGQTAHMASISFAHSGLCVSDLEASLRFYTEGLGFELAEGYDVGDEVADTLEVPHGVQLRSQMIVKDGTKIELLGWTSPGVHGRPSQTRNQLGLTHLSFTVEDMPAVEARLVTLGGTVIDSTRTHIDMGGATLDLLFLADPDGTRIELMETIVAS